MRQVSIEFRKCRARWERTGLLARYLSGNHVLDIGFRGSDPGAVPVTEAAIGIERSYPGYDGTRLPFEDGSQDAVFASAVLEHIPNYREVLSDWYRVIKPGGYIVIFVPNKYLYERRPDLPSRWNGDHRRFYTPASLLREIEESLPPNGFRIRHLLDDDEGYRYDHQPTSVPAGCYQIEIVLEKIVPPSYSSAMEYSDPLRRAIANLDRIVIDTIACLVDDRTAVPPLRSLLPGMSYFTPFHRLMAHFVYSDPAELRGARLLAQDLKSIVRPLLDLVEVDEQSYVQRYQELGNLRDPALHWRTHGYFEGRMGTSFEFNWHEMQS